MSNKTEDRTYFRELIRRLKELRVSADNGEIIVPNDDEDILEFNELELPITQDIFHKMTVEWSGTRTGEMIFYGKGLEIQK